MRRSHMAQDMGYPSQSQGYQHSQDIIENENDRQENLLSTKVRALKSLTIDIGNEVRDQNNMLKGMDDDFDSSGGLLHASMKKLKAITSMGGYKQMWYLLLFCLFVFFVCWLIIRSR
ncbi:BET1 homolog isoform X1 [Ruditapes philippinarum]|uniref:BET1 homolog isoform X1 n=2 Tax=Ruditapes philippinarum TaxID=129788 RepID=UPI00295AEA5A|nr:BET1 homolog isoform X1 [Ruditapes philippinarum]